MLITNSKRSASQSQEQTAKSHNHMIFDPSPLLCVYWIECLLFILIEARYRFQGSETGGCGCPLTTHTNTKSGNLNEVIPSTAPAGGRL